jgi:hypothetical protein
MDLFKRLTSLFVGTSDAAQQKTVQDRLAHEAWEDRKKENLKKVEALLAQQERTCKEEAAKKQAEQKVAPRDGLDELKQALAKIRATPQPPQPQAQPMPAAAAHNPLNDPRNIFSTNYCFVPEGEPRPRSNSGAGQQQEPDSPVVVTVRRLLEPPQTN